MALEDYLHHKKIIDTSFIRNGVVDTLEEDKDGVILDGLCDLENTLRLGRMSSGGVLSDLGSGAFSGNFLELIRIVAHKEFLSYKRHRSTMTVEDFLREQSLKNIESGEDHEELDYLEPDGNYSEGVTDENFDDGVSEQEIFEEVSEPIEGTIASTDEVLPIIYTWPLGIDEDNFDVWDIGELELEDDEEDEDIDFGSMETSLEPEVGETVLLSEPLGEDSDGFDVWEEPVVEDLKTFGIDLDGFDVWKEPIEEPEDEDGSVELEDVEDGWDHSQDSDRVGLGELKSSCYGSDDDGFDVWINDGALSIDDSEVEDPKLGRMLSQPHGVDDSGFDVWVSPVSAVTSSNSPTASPGTVPAPGRTNISGYNGKNSSRTLGGKTSEDKTADILEMGASKVAKFGKRFAKYMISK